jgi:hypothetical protein
VLLLTLPLLPACLPACLQVKKVANYCLSKLAEERITMAICEVTWDPEVNEAKARAVAAQGHQVLQITCNGVVSSAHLSSCCCCISLVLSQHQRTCQVLQAQGASAVSQAGAYLSFASLWPFACRETLIYRLLSCSWCRST